MTEHHAAVFEGALLAATKVLAAVMVGGSIVSVVQTDDGGTTNITFGNTAFWTCMATIAFTVQLILQRYYASQAAAKADQAAKKVAAVAVAADIATEKVEVVRSTLEQTNAANNVRMNEIRDTGERVHTLVNNNMSLALKANADLAMRIADLTGKESDRIAAEAAKKASGYHDSAQRSIDDKDKKREQDKAL